MGHPFEEASARMVFMMHVLRLLAHIVNKGARERKLRRTLNRTHLEPGALQLAQSAYGKGNVVVSHSSNQIKCHSSS